MKYKLKRYDYAGWGIMVCIDCDGWVYYTKYIDGRISRRYHSINSCKCSDRPEELH